MFKDNWCDCFYLLYECLGNKCVVYLSSWEADERELICLNWIWCAKFIFVVNSANLIPQKLMLEWVLKEN